MQDQHTDILIVGGSTGGCAAAMAATSLGYRVTMTEVTDWIGGQLTSQAVPPDEHPWIEHFGCTRRYRQFRDGRTRGYRSSRNHTVVAAAWGPAGSSCRESFSQLKPQQETRICDARYISFSH